MTTQDEVLDFARQSTRPPGKCLGLANNDIVGHFGRLGNTPRSATAAADELAKATQLYESACPDYPHVDFYYFKENGIEYGHVDWHFPQRGIHLADSSRITVKLNASGTVGTYPSWGLRRGWARVPALSASISIVNDPTPAPAPNGGSSLQEVYARVQRALGGRGRYQGPDDGVFGENTWRGIQFTVSTKNRNTYTGPIDGKPGPKTLMAVQAYAKQYGDYTGPLDGAPGIHTWEAFALGLERRP